MIWELRIQNKDEDFKFVLTKDIAFFSRFYRDEGYQVTVRLLYDTIRSYDRKSERRERNKHKKYDLQDNSQTEHRDEDGMD